MGLFVVNTKLLGGAAENCRTVGAAMLMGMPVSAEIPLSEIVTPLPEGGQMATPAALEMAGQFVALMVLLPLVRFNGWTVGVALKLVSR